MKVFSLSRIPDFFEETMLLIPSLFIERETFETEQINPFLFSITVILGAP